MGASVNACTLAGRTTSCAGADRLGRTTATEGTAISAVSRRSAVRAWIRGRMPATTMAAAVSTASRRIHQDDRRGFLCPADGGGNSAATSVNMRPSFSTLMTLPDSHAGLFQTYVNT